MSNVWRKASLGLLAGGIAITSVFAATGIAGAATVASAVPAGHASAARLSAPAALTWPIVKQGATGERVFAIQYLLNARNGAGLAVDGKFGPLTATAVKNFQKKFKLSVDGQVGPQTWAALTVTVKSGNSGQAVSAVQHNLRFAYGFTALAVDGVFGPRTAAAVKSFQAKYKLAADGIVGVNTWNALIVHE